MSVPVFIYCFLVTSGLTLCSGQKPAYFSNLHIREDSSNYIKGVIVNRHDKTPVPWALVRVYYDKGFRKWDADTTDVDGTFFVSLKEGHLPKKLKIEVRFVGYMVKVVKIKKPLLPIEGLRIEIETAALD